jgi:hypothetical protein
MTRERISHFKRKRDAGAPCEAPEHVSDCNGLGSTIDHLTPKCIARVLGWRRKKLNAADNLQLLSEECHQAKDRDTAMRRNLLIEQLEGRTVRFGDHFAK